MTHCETEKPDTGPKCLWLWLWGYYGSIWCSGGRGQDSQGQSEWPWSRECGNGRQNRETWGNINRKWIIIWLFCSGWSKCESTCPLVVRRVPPNGQHCGRQAVDPAIPRTWAILCGMRIQQWNCFNHNWKNSWTGHRLHLNSWNIWLFFARLLLRCYLVRTFHATD